MYDIVSNKVGLARFFNKKDTHTHIMWMRLRPTSKLIRRRKICIYLNIYSLLFFDCPVFWCYYPHTSRV